jgi:thioesterase domain-containing protein
LAAALGAEQPVIGLQDPNANRDDYPEASIEGLAAQYVDALRSYQPDGPYHVLGWSFGGYLAFEIARSLEAQGAEVGLVVILDTLAADITREILSSTDSAVLLEVLAQDAGLAGVTRQGLEGLSFDAQIDRVAELARDAGLTGDQVDVRRTVRRQVRTFRARIRASQAYFPASYPGTITVVRAADNVGLPADAGVDYGWGKVAARVNMETISGRHATLMQAPHVQALAARLHALLASSDARASATSITR